MLTISTGGDIDWWRSDTGKVTEHRDRDDITCTLLLKNHDGQFQFMWDNVLPLRVIVEQSSWNLPDSRMWTVSLRIGSAWLGGGNGDPDIPALTAPHGVMFVLNQPIMDMLGSARDVTVRTPAQDFGLSVPQNKMEPLVKALRKCTAQIKRKHVQLPG